MSLHILRMIFLYCGNISTRRFAPFISCGISTGIAEAGSSILPVLAALSSIHVRSLFFDSCHKLRRTRFTMRQVLPDSGGRHSFPFQSCYTIIQSSGFISCSLLLSIHIWLSPEFAWSQLIPCRHRSFLFIDFIMQILSLNIALVSSSASHSNWIVISASIISYLFDSQFPFKLFCVEHQSWWVISGMSIGVVGPILKCLENLVGITSGLGCVELLVWWFVDFIIQIHWTWQDDSCIVSMSTSLPRLVYVRTFQILP